MAGSEAQPSSALAGSRARGIVVFESPRVGLGPAGGSIAGVKLEGTRQFEAPPEVVWRVLDDPARMAQAMPGVESFELEDAAHWTASVKVPLGAAGLQLRFDMEKRDERALEHAGLRAKGTGVGAFVRMETAFDLEPAGNSTLMHWQADFQIAGKAGNVGQRVLQPIVRGQVENVLNALDRQVADLVHERAIGP
jgi:carbon monoxide dehydrogenase subunit G